MSNLYKQWFVQTDTVNARVINSDAVMAERMEKNAYQVLKEQAQTKDGFAEGIVAGDAAKVIKAETETDFLTQTKEEIDQLLADAHGKAENILAQAREEAQEIEETAKNKGYQDGKAQIDRELSELQSQLEDSYRKKMNNLDTEYAAKRADMENDLVDVILSVFNKVFHIQFDDKKHILMHLIDDAILNIEGEKKFRVKVSESNVSFLENHKEEMLDRVGHDIELEILADSTMEGNACIIETDSGVFDCSLGAQLENLIKDIRSLCS